MKTTINQFFGLTEQKTSIKEEFFAAVTTFMTMSYIIVINPQMLGAAGMDVGAVMTATILAAAASSIYMGIAANYPFALAPAMGINAYFTYGIVLRSGYSWEEALGASLIASIILIILNILGIRQAIIEVIPKSLRVGTIAGIGALLTFIGLKESGVIVANPATLVALGNLAEPHVLFTGAGIFMMATLSHYRIWGAALWSILFVWLLSLSLGYAKWEGLLSMPPSLSPLLFGLKFPAHFDAHYYAVILSLVFVCLFDAAGALLALADAGNFFDKEGKIPRVRRALSADALGSAFGALTGTSPLAAYLESAAGITAGGRTGLTAIFVGLFFLLALLFSPLVNSIPLFATTPVLIIIGILMARQIRFLDCDEYADMLPGFLIFMTIPLTFSIVGGIGIGFMTYPVLKFLHGEGKKVHWLLWVIAILFLSHILLEQV